MKLINRLIPHKHKFLPIVYGLLTINVDEKGKPIKTRDFIAGGCCVPDNYMHFACEICGKEVIIKRLNSKDIQNETL